MHPVLHAQCSNPGIVHARTGNPPVAQKCAQRLPVSWRLAKHVKQWGLKPSVYLFQRTLKRRRRSVNPRMRYDREELMETLPGKRPWHNAFGEFLHAMRRCRVKQRFSAVRVNEDVRIDGDQTPPLPS